MTAIYTVQQFVEDAREIISRGWSEERTQQAISEPLARVIARENCLADVAPEGNPSPDKGFPIYRADDLSILCVIWHPNATTPIHNHNGWALEGIISGVERNRNFVRLDDGSKPWVAELGETEPTLVSTGETTRSMAHRTTFMLSKFLPARHWLSTYTAMTFTSNGAISSSWRRAK